METYLIHHGIKGQKWGERNYQNPDGTLTEAGKKRYYSYNYDISSFKQKVKDARAERNGLFDRAGNVQVQRAKGRLQDAKALNRLNGKKISSTQQKMIDHYKDKGYTEDEAVLKTHRMLKGAKTAAELAVVGATAAGVAAGYKASGKNFVTKMYTGKIPITPENVAKAQKFASYAPVMNKIIKEGVKDVGIAALSAGATVGLSAGATKIVSDYRKAHPNTKLNDREILNNNGYGYVWR